MSRHEAVEVIESADGKFRALILHDEDPMSPKDWDTFGTLITWHRRYRFQEHGPDKGFVDGPSFRDMMREEGYLYIDVAMIDHSGISLYESMNAHPCDPGAWDSGQVGFLYVSRERAIKEFGKKGQKRLTGNVIFKAEQCLRVELKTWDQYVRGEVYVVVVECIETRETLESCGGFYGLDQAKDEAKGMLATVEMQEKQAVEQIDGRMA